MRRILCKDREHWLKERAIGGSDAATIIHRNKYKSAIDLYLEKIGAKKPKDLSKNKRVQHGVASEPLIREMFKLNFPEYSMYYKEFELLIDDEHDFLRASLDGELTHPTLGKGVWECKTAEPRNKEVWADWGGGIPVNYFAQILHYLMVTGYSYAIVSSQLIHRRYKAEINELLWTETRNYFFKREDYLDAIDYLREEEIKFWEQHIVPRIEPEVRIQLGE